MKPHKHTPPPDLEAWLQTQPEAEREALRDAWTHFSTSTYFAMQSEQVDKGWSAVAAATAPNRTRSLWLNIAAGLALLLSGWAIGRWSAPAAQPAAASHAAAQGKQRYALLVKNDDTPAENPMEQFQVYSEWLKQLQKERWADGEALHGKVWRMRQSESGAPQPIEHVLKASADEISGYFLFEAADESEALKIAETCPHLRYGGTLELRALH